MKIIDNVKEIFNKHPFSYIFTDNYKNVYKLIEARPELKPLFNNDEISDHLLTIKYDKYIPSGWYGFDIGIPINPVWMVIIDKILELCISVDPKFEIHQIKLKFGTINFYVESDIIEDIHEISVLISKTLNDNALIY